jgi:hypothetical protein
MAVQLRFNTQVFPESLTVRLDCGVQSLRLRSDRPTLVMHGLEEPGGRISRHWDVERP